MYSICLFIPHIIWYIQWYSIILAKKMGKISENFQTCSIKWTISNLERSDSTSLSFKKEYSFFEPIPLIFLYPYPLAKTNENAKSHLIVHDGFSFIYFQHVIHACISVYRIFVYIHVCFELVWIVYSFFNLFFSVP